LVCGGGGVKVDRFGKYDWFRCRVCGLEFMQRAPKEESGSKGTGENNTTIPQ
jgi:hypothetical protein